MADPKSAVQTVYHIKDGAVQMYTIDARNAVSQHPKEWATKPWTEDDALEVATRPDGDQPAAAQ